MNFAGQFGANLRSQRLRAGISQEELSYRASIHRIAIGMIERGERIPKANTVAKLAGALGIDPGDFFEGISWEPGNVRHGQFFETEVPGLGTVQRRVDIGRRPEQKP